MGAGPCVALRLCRPTLRKGFAFPAESLLIGEATPPARGVASQIVRKG
jgi:hypothetical protein